MATYNDLSTGVEYYSDRTDVTATDRERLFRIACEKLNRKLRVPEMISSLSLTGADFPYTDSTNAILEIEAIYIERAGVVSQLEYVPLAKLKQIQANGSGSTPKYFTSIGQQILLGPEPATDDAISVYYYARQDDTLSGTETNVFLQYYESMTLYYTLSELYKALHDSQRSAEYDGMASALLEEANLHAWQRRYPARLTVRNS